MSSRSIRKDNIIILDKTLANRATSHKRRFKMLDTLLKWEGELSNARVRDVFDIQTVRASRLLAAYRDAYPDRVRWDMTQKRYMRVPTRERYGDSADDYLDLLFEKENALGWIERLDTRISTVKADVMIALRRAIATAAAITINYASMAHPEGSVRTIFPRVIVQAGRRWHVRAWCSDKQEYRDFVLGRIRRIEALQPAEAPSVPDKAWDTIVDIRLRPHRLLTEAQARVVRDELFEGAVARRVRTRACLVAYVIQDVRASVSEKEMPPEFQIEVANLNAVRKYLFADSIRFCGEERKVRRQSRGR